MPVPELLRATSVLSSNADGFAAFVLDALAAACGVEVEIVGGDDRLQLLERGDVDLAFVCGGPYSRMAEKFDLLAAPVMRAGRYGGRPIYFTDILALRQGVLEDFRGSAIAYNEEISHSGYTVPCAHLASIGAPRGFFRRAVRSGSHLESLALLRRGKVDAAAIDSMVLDFERNRDDLDGLHVVASLGPSPAPPVVARRGLREAACLREALLSLDCSGWPVARFAAVDDADYDEIRRLAEVARGARL